MIRFGLFPQQVAVELCFDAVIDLMSQRAKAASVSPVDIEYAPSVGQRDRLLEALPEPIIVFAEAREHFHSAQVLIPNERCESQTILNDSAMSCQEEEAGKTTVASQVDNSNGKGSRAQIILDDVSGARGKVGREVAARSVAKGEDGLRMHGFDKRNAGRVRARVGPGVFVAGGKVLDQLAIGDLQTLEALLGLDALGWVVFKPVGVAKPGGRAEGMAKGTPGDEIALKTESGPMLAALRAGIDADAKAASPHGPALVDGATILSRNNQEPQLAIQLLRLYLASPNKSADSPAFQVQAQLSRLLEQQGDLAGARQQIEAAAALAREYHPTPRRAVSQ